ncbi:MAG: AmmeMemoRadiSam system protein B [Planctomycetes bacterium]|nr:AmmeMemoRadiSam system protein B [Planctomycetota bacterium]
MCDSAVVRPRMRPVEAFPVEHEGEQMVLVQDPCGLADAALVVSPAGFFVVAHFDGEHDLEQVRSAFASRFGDELPSEQLDRMIEQLDLAHYLDSDRFAEFYRSLVDAYRAAPARTSRDAASFGAEEDGLPATLDRMLDGCRTDTRSVDGRRLAGLVAPHLDYARGGLCYAAAYRTLSKAGAIERVVVLGTNHFGRAASVVATGKDFETPLGVTRTDRAFLHRLRDRCGVDLCAHEFDHQREHSVELQVLVLQHLFGPAAFEIVPILCHDPCGPDGAGPGDGVGVALDVFGKALGDLIQDDPRRTLIVAGADLSHFGLRFGDQCDLDATFLAEVEHKDREALGAVVAGRSDLFIEGVRDRGNDTRICSIGCIYALMTALPGARPELLRYHQAVDRDSGTAVSCSAIALWQPS